MPAVREMPIRRCRPSEDAVDAESLDALLDGIELSRDIEISRREFAEGKGISSDEVFRKMDEMIQGWCSSSPSATRGCS